MRVSALIVVSVLFLVCFQVTAEDYSGSGIFALKDLKGPRTLIPDNDVEYTINISCYEYGDAYGHLAVWLFNENGQQARDSRNFVIDFSSPNDYMFCLPARSYFDWTFECDFGDVPYGKYEMRIQLIDDDMYGDIWATYTCWLTFVDEIPKDTKKPTDASDTEYNTTFEDTCAVIMGGACCCTFIAGIGAIAIAIVWSRGRRRAEPRRAP